MPAVQSKAKRSDVDALTVDQFDLCVMIAVAEPYNISSAARLASALGLRESQSRAHSTTTLARALEPLIGAGLVRHNSSGYECSQPMRVLQAAAARGRLERIVETCSLMLFGAAPQRHWGANDVDRLVFLARIALAAVTPELGQLLNDLAARMDDVTVAQVVLVPDLLDHIDATWFTRVLPVLSARWLPLCLNVVEASQLPSAKLLDYFVEAAKAEPHSSPSVVLPLAGMALLHARFADARALAAASSPDVARAVEAAVLVTEGRYAEAARLVPTPSKGLAQGTGIIALLNALALLYGRVPTSPAYATRLLTAGSRKPSQFRFSHSLIKHIVESATFPDRPLPRALVDDSYEQDCLSPITYALWVCWVERSEREARHVRPLLSQLATSAAEHGWIWLSAEAHALRQHVALILGSSPEPATAARPSELQAWLPLLSWMEVKANWEQALDRLERLMPDQVVEASEERVIWRVEPSHLLIEPYLQKLRASGWTRGRKLAVKHLLPGAAQPPKLDAEDARVALFAREERYLKYGYPEIVHTIAAEAFTALIGHPRVYIGEANVSTEVVRGHVQLLLREQGDSLAVTVSPADFSPPLSCVVEGSRLVVYSLPPEALPLLKEFSRGVSFPISAKERVLSVLGRGSRVLPVQSFDSASADATLPSVPADPRPWLRITSNAQGLSVLVSVRPLGQHGLQVTPGKGARALIGQVEGGTVSCQRDFAEELAMLARIFELCPVFESYQVAPQHFVVTDNADALELLAALRELDSQVQAEWPQGKPIQLRSRVTRASLRGTVRSVSDFFLAAGTLTVDADLSLELAELLELLGSSEGRFLRLSNGDYVELEQQLRDALETVAASRSSMRRTDADRSTGVALAQSALAALDAMGSDSLGFAFDADAQRHKERVESAFRKKYPVPRGLQAELREYQREGFVWLARLAELGLSACLADDMGLGKTIQLLALLLHRAKSGPALIVAPLSVCGNWRAEIERYAPGLLVRWFVGVAREEALAGLSRGSVFITSYNLLQQDIELLRTTRWSTVVLDEAQFIKNPDSQRARAAYALEANFRVVATGTPVENHVGDLFGLFHFLLPELLGSREQFSKRFVIDAEGEPGLRARRGLRQLLQPFVLRRTKSQVLSELPPLTEIVHRVELSAQEATLYEALRLRALSKLESAGKSQAAGSSKQNLDPTVRFQVLAEITRLRRLCCHPDLVRTEENAGATMAGSKLTALLELVTELREGGHRALVFSQFVDVLALVRSALDARNISYQYLDGSTPSARRSQAVNAFQSGEGDLFLISLRAGGFGINLTAADYVIHIDPWWNPAAEAQATDRAHRIGQARPVTVYRLICAGTIEERIQELQLRKRELAASLLEDTDQAAKLGAEQLKELLLGGPLAS